MKSPHRILIIDDDPATRGTLTMILDEFQVDAVGDVASGRKALTDGLYQVVIVDFELPDGRGSTLLDLPVRNPMTRIILTGHSEFQEVRELQRSGEVLVLFKPVDPDQLLTWVRHGVTMTRLASSMTEIKKRTTTMRDSGPRAVVVVPEAPAPAPTPKAPPPGASRDPFKDSGTISDSGRLRALDRGDPWRRDAGKRPADDPKSSGARKGIERGETARLAAEAARKEAEAARKAAGESGPEPGT